MKKLLLHVFLIFVRIVAILLIIWVFFVGISSYLLMIDRFFSLGTIERIILSPLAFVLMFGTSSITIEIWKIFKKIQFRIEAENEADGMLDRLGDDLAGLYGFALDEDEME